MVAVGSGLQPSTARRVPKRAPVATMRIGVELKIMVLVLVASANGVEFESCNVAFGR